jgi:hypothetical protein
MGCASRFKAKKRVRSDASEWVRSLIKDQIASKWVQSLIRDQMEDGLILRFYKFWGFFLFLHTLEMAASVYWEY